MIGASAKNPILPSSTEHLWAVMVLAITVAVGALLVWLFRWVCFRLVTGWGA